MDIQISFASLAQIFFAIIAVSGLMYVQRTKDREEKYERHKERGEKESMKDIDQDTKIQNRLFFFPYGAFILYLLIILLIPQFLLYANWVVSFLLIYFSLSLYYLAQYPYDKVKQKCHRDIASFLTLFWKK